MDKNCINTGVCFMPSGETHFDVRCGAVNVQRGILATGTDQGAIIVWEVGPPSDPKVQAKASLGRFKELYEERNRLNLSPAFVLVSNNNSVAFPVVQVEFALGASFNASLIENEDSSRDFNAVEFGEDILLSLHEDSTLCIWSLTSYRCLHKIRGPPFPIRSIRVLPDRRFLAVVGDTKVNVIDIWNISLVETLEISDPAASKETQSVTAASSQNASSKEEQSDSSSWEEPASAPKILATACSVPPLVRTDDASKGGGDACPLIFVALTTGNQIVLWDLTYSILSHKSTDAGFNGPVKVISEWDCAYALKVPIFAKAPRKSQPHRAGRNSRTKYPTLLEHVYELEHEPGRISVLDNFVFLAVGSRILVWFYEAHELTRAAEILSFSDLDFNTSRARWFGLRTLRTEIGNVLACWLGSGRMKLFLVPDANSKGHFATLKRCKIPRPDLSFHDFDFYPTHCHDRQDISFYIFSHSGKIAYTRDGFTRWHPREARVSLHTSRHLAFTCIVDRDGILYKIELFSDGELRAVNAAVFTHHKMASPNLFEDLLNHTHLRWRYSTFVITQDINDHLYRYKHGPSHKCSLLHSTGDYLVATLENAVIVYSLSSLRVKFLINALHLFKIRAVHNVCTLSTGVKGPELVELTSSFVTVDAAGYMVLVSVHELASQCKSQHLSDHIRITIDEEAIYRNDEVQGHCDFEFSDPYDLEHSEFFLYLREYRGVYRMNSRYQLRDVSVDRVALDRNRDLLLVLTSTCVLTYRVSNGDFLTRLQLLSLYRQAIFSSRAEYKQLKSSLSISEALAMILNKDTSETPEQEMPNYPSSLALFSEKYKRRLSCSLYLSHLTLSIKTLRPKRRHTSTSLPSAFGPASPSDAGTAEDNKANVKLKLRFRRPEKLSPRRLFTGKFRKTPRFDWKLVYAGETETFNYGVPVLIFPLEVLLSVSAKSDSSNDQTRGTDNTTSSNNSAFTSESDAKHRAIDFLDLVKDGVFCYLGVPHGSLTIPLKYDLHNHVHTLIRARTGVSKATLLNMRAEGLPGIGQSPSEDYSIFGSRPSDRPDEAPITLEDGFEEGTDLPRSPKLELNRYHSTCAYFYMSYLSEGIPQYQERVLERHSSAPDLDPPDHKLALGPEKNEGGGGREPELDVWLLLLVMTTVEAEGSFRRVLSYLTTLLKSLKTDYLDLLVARALANIHVSQSFKLKGKANSPQIHICTCQSTVFTFGTKCGSCLETRSGLDHSEEMKSFKNLNEESSLILLTLISIHFLSSLRNVIRLGLKSYTVASYVARQLMTKLLQLEENAEVLKSNQVTNKIGLVRTNSGGNFNTRGFLLELFAQGFGVVWDLATFSKQSILPDQIRYTKYSLLFREDFHNTEGFSMDEAYFILYVFQYYHHLRDKWWNRLLLISCSQNTQLAIDIIGWIVKRRKLGNKPIISALRLITEFMENYNELGFAFLPDLVGVIIKCLDPLDYNIRVLLLKPATNALFYLVKNVPMVDFHQDTQRFAVGSQSGCIIIYDIRTATKWRMFLGKPSPIACVAFGSNGSLIAAYYSKIPCFIVWKCSSSGLIGSLLSNTSKEYKSLKLKSISALPTFDQMRNIKIQYKSANKWFLHREDGRGYMIST